MTVNGALSRPRDETDPALPEPQRYILVGENAVQRWIVKDNRGRLGAVFRSAKVALRFAQREASALGCGIVINASPVELDCLRPTSAFR